MGATYTLEDGREVKIYTERLSEVARSTLFKVEDFVEILQKDEDLVKYGEILTDLLDVAKKNMKERFEKIAQIIGREYVLLACYGQPGFEVGQVIALSETYDGKPPRNPEEEEKESRLRHITQDLVGLISTVRKYAEGDQGNLEVVEKSLQALEKDDKDKAIRMVQILLGNEGNGTTGRDLGNNSEEAANE